MVADATMALLDAELEPMTPDELRTWRRQHDLSQPQLAARLEIAAGTLRNYEQGIRKIPPFMRLALERLDEILRQEGADA